jgi:predicted DNA-binding protein with PD1-like motif
METKKINSELFFIRLEKNEEIINSLKNFAKRNKIKGAFFWGIGAGKDFLLGYYDLKKKKYLKRKIKKECEIVSLLGNISHGKDEIFVHTHLTIADKNFKIFGGHLFSGLVSVTLELFLFKIKIKLNRQLFPEIGLNLITFKKSHQ